MPAPPPPRPRLSLLDRVLLFLVRWRRLQQPAAPLAPAPAPGTVPPALPPPPPPLPSVPPVLDGATSLAPHQEQALLEAKNQIEAADERLAWMRDRSTVLGRRPASLSRKAP